MKNSLLALFILCVISFFACDTKDTIDTEYPDSMTQKDTFLDDWTYKIIPNINDTYTKAEFRMWIHDSIVHPNAILVLTPGFNSSGLGLAHNSAWQEFALQEKLVLIGITFEDNNSSYEYYYNALEGTGKALIKAVNKICERNDLPIVKELPFILCGHSAGGCFSYSFSIYQPERVVGYINIKGGPMIIQNQIDIPGLLVAGEFDYPELIVEKALKIRQKNGLVCYAIEPGAYHEWGEPYEIMQPFIRALIKYRLQENGAMKIISESDGLLGNMSTFDFSLYNNYLNAKDSAAWLISEDFAQTWQSFISAE